MFPIFVKKLFMYCNVIVVRFSGTISFALCSQYLFLDKKFDFFNEKMTMSEF